MHDKDGLVFFVLEVVVQPSPDSKLGSIQETVLHDLSPSPSSGRSRGRGVSNHLPKHKPNHNPNPVPDCTYQEAAYPPNCIAEARS